MEFIVDEPLDAATWVGLSMTQHVYKLSESEYFEFVQYQYMPNAFEYNEGDSRFVAKSHNAWVNGQRFHRMLQMLDRHYTDTGSATVHAVDIGFFPGTWIQLARHFWTGATWQGVGLCISGEFRAWAGREGIALYEADMDPFYAQHDVATALPCENDTLDLVVASEIFEHLISPLQFLQETSRTLKSGGLMLLTTPNVSNIGALVHLLKGDSNYERLERSPMFLAENEWRGHIRFYSKREMIWLADRYGFELVEHQYYHDDYPMSVLKHKGLSALANRLIRRVFGLIPWFRGGQIMMLKKR